MDRLGVVIESSRLRLVAASEAYAPVIFQEFTAEITRFMFPKPADDISETLGFIRGARERIRSGQELDMAILLRETGEFIGHGGLHHIDGETPELGIWIKRGAHGHAYGREAVTALAGWAFENLNVRYLTYPVDRRNAASRTIPEALGGRVEAEYEHRALTGNVLDIVEYRIYGMSAAT
jgi:RimJ/RimL family protein N-acetyltransferase